MFMRFKCTCEQDQQIRRFAENGVKKRFHYLWLINLYKGNKLYKVNKLKP